MSRFLKIAIVLLAIAAMATPVMAEDMLSLGGQMRVRGWYKDADNANDSTATWADQRLRIGGKLSIADGVSITFRTDITESVWGSGNVYGSGRIGMQQWDRAHIDLKFSDGFSVRAGQQFVWFLESGAFNTQSNGVKAVIGAGPVKITPFFFLEKNNDVAKSAAHAVVSEDPAAPGTCACEWVSASDPAYKSDGFTYGANAAFGDDTFKANVLFAAQNKVNNADEDVYLFGADVKLNFDVVNIIAEMNYFTGDANATQDAYGLQGFVDASFGLGEAMTLGGQVYYADGDTKDAQYITLGNDFGGWDPLNEHGTGLNNEQITPGSANMFGTSARPYGIFAPGAGVMAGRIYLDAKIGDDMTLGGSVSYLEPEEDSVTAVDSAINTTVGLHYNVMANTSIGAQVEYISIDQSSAASPDAPEDALAAGFGLFVNF